GQAVPATGLPDELVAAGTGQRVKACAPVVRGDAPLGRDPLEGFEPLQRGVERAVVDQQLAAGRRLDRVRDALAGLRAEEQRAEDEHVERALQQRDLVAVGRASGFHLTQEWAIDGLDVNPSGLTSAAGPALGL